MNRRVSHNRAHNYYDGLISYPIYNGLLPGPPSIEVHLIFKIKVCFFDTPHAH